MKHPELTQEDVKPQEFRGSLFHIEKKLYVVFLDTDFGSKQCFSSFISLLFTNRRTPFVLIAILLYSFFVTDF